MMERITKEHAEVMVREARRTIEHYMRTGKLARAQLPKDIDIPVGVFVTLKKDRKSGERLRGCIGFPEPIYEFSRALAKAAVSAAFSDPRFPPVEEEELSDISIEVSLLSAPHPLEVPRKELPSAIEVGKHGIVVERGINKGLLLPQVAVEEGWDSEELLAYACLKAGLAPDSWLDERTKVCIFTATVFKELEPNGEVVEVELRKP